MIKMELKDKIGNRITAYKIKKPRKKNLTSWNTTTISINGENIILWNYIIRGNSEYFEFNGDWYVIREENLSDTSGDFLIFKIVPKSQMEVQNK